MFCKEIGIKNPFLESFNKSQRIDLLCAFAAKIRRNHFGRTKKKVLQGCSVEDTLRSVRSYFRINNRIDPGIDENGLKSLKLTRILKSYTSSDPNVRNQLALPIDIFTCLLQNRLCVENIHMGLLATGALFFGMRSCEYLKVPKQEQKLTKPLCLRNFRFFRNNRIIDLSDNNIHSATYITITFESQKNGKKDETIIQHASRKILCPVRIWAEIIQLILTYDRTDLNTPIFYYEKNKKPMFMKSAVLISHLRATVDVLNPDTFGLSTSRIGTHSIRTSFAMLLVLAGTRESVIMLQGRWKSFSFLKYIRPQIQQFSKDLSSKMISGSHAHFNVKSSERNIEQLSSLKSSGFDFNTRFGNNI